MIFTKQYVSRNLSYNEGNNIDPLMLCSEVRIRKTISYTREKLIFNFMVSRKGGIARLLESDKN